MAKSKQAPPAAGKRGNAPAHTGEKGARPPDPASQGGSRPPPGLDDERHAAAQRAAHMGEVVRQAFVPGCMASALGTNGLFDGRAFRVYLDNFLRDAGAPTDPLERLLLEQAAFASLRVADLHTQAAGAKSVDAVKVFTAAAARLLGEVRRLAVTLKVYRGRAPAAEPLRIAQVG